MLTIPVNQTDHILGPATAKVAVVEYGDFECPYCRQAYGAMKVVVNRYDGRIKFVFRHFPLTAWHPNAELAAEAAEAAGAQHKFWPMYDLLFEHQHNLKLDALRRYAAMLELDPARFDNDLNDHIYLQRVREHQDGGIKSQVRSMPAFFVNGELQDVTFGMEHLEAAIDRALRS
ncbi:Protein-disulfide isomerase [Collimonas sp. OK307]|nr:Protein-disulfide isomerase [Collimonas sp. OK307]